jgi:voltage-gated potassium channel
VEHAFGFRFAAISIFAYIGSLAVEAIARGVIGGFSAERRRLRAIEALREHYIICGFGRVGQRVTDEFRHEGARFVVVDYSPEAAAGTEEELRALEGLFAARETVAC